MLEQIESYLKDHVLTKELDTEHYKAFRLHNPNEGRMYSVLIVFTPEGIFLHGDIAFGCGVTNGISSRYGYGLNWFKGRKSDCYLCSKFLMRTYQPDIVHDDIKRYITQTDEPDKWSRVLEDLTDSPSVEELCEAIEGYFSDPYEYQFGYDYPRHDAELLIAVHNAFVRLYKE